MKMGTWLLLENASECRNAKVNVGDEARVNVGRGEREFLYNEGRLVLEHF